MRTGIKINVTETDRVQLGALVAARVSPQKHVWGDQIILLTADGMGTVAIMAATGKSKTCVWCWQERFMVECQCHCNFPQKWRSKIPHFCGSEIMRPVDRHLRI